MAKSKRTQIVSGEEDRAHLERIRTDPHSILKHVQRASIVLHLGDGPALSQTMRATGMSKPTVWRWWDRFLLEGVGGLLRDIPRRRGRKPISEEKVGELIELAMSPPPEHAGHWTLRALAKKLDIAVSTVFGILERNGPEPHKIKTFKVSRDPRFEMKVRDVVGLYVNPPDHAVVISVDEKTQIQALGRTQRPLPMKPGHPETRTHDCKRNGTACLMAALDVATGKVAGQMVDRHRSEEFLAFLDHVAGGIEPGTPVHAVLDNVSSPQVGRSRPVAEGPSGLDVPFRPDLGLLDECRRGVLLEALQAKAPALGLQLARRVHRGDRGLHRAPQRQ